MSVYFVYRSHYEGPTGKYIKRFEEHSVLEWFQNHWISDDSDKAYEIAKKIFGCEVYGFAHLFNEIHENSLAKPASMAKLKQYLRAYPFVESEIKFSKNCIQIITDDDELEMAYYFFDEQFNKENAHKTSYLLYDNWHLPAAYSEKPLTSKIKTKRLSPGDANDGVVYLVFLAFYDSLNLTDLEGAYSIKGIRLEELPAYLNSCQPTDDWPFELRLLRSQLTGDLSLTGLKASLSETTRFPVVGPVGSLEWADFGLNSVEKSRQEAEQMLKQLKYHDSIKAMDRSLINVDKHIAQLCLYTGIEDKFNSGTENQYHQWIFFDDKWLGANEDLGNSLLVYARQWDVLS